MNLYGLKKRLHNQIDYAIFIITYSLLKEVHPALREEESAVLQVLQVLREIQVPDPDLVPPLAGDRYSFPREEVAR